MNQPAFEMKHGASQQDFSTGAKRDTQAGKLRYDLISPFALKRLAVIYTKGAEHYGDRNWEKGIPFSRMVASMMRHLNQFLMGDMDEDHLAQAIWNGVGILHFQEMLGRHVLPESLDDLPDYSPEYVAIPKAVAPTTALFADDRHELMYLKLIDLGCPASVARQIAGGTTFSDARPELDSRFVYVAGPMRGYEKFNFPAFDAARDAMLAKGFHVISPADIDRVTEKDAEDPSKVDVTDQSRFVLRDFWAIFFLKKSGDFNGIVLLDKWFKSTGASSEFGLGKWLDLRFYEPDGSGYYFALDGKCPKEFTPENRVSNAEREHRIIESHKNSPTTVGSMDGDWDWADECRGDSHFYRVNGSVSRNVQYYNGDINAPAFSVNELREMVQDGRITRLSTEEIVKFTKRANENQ